MRRILSRAPATLLTFSCGLLLTLLCRGVVQNSVRSLALSAEERLKSLHVAEGDNNFRKRRILFDPRDRWETSGDERAAGGWYDDLEALGKELKDRNRRLLPKLFPGGYLEGVGRCDAESSWPLAETEADLARVRERGQFSPNLPHWEKGSFTEPGAFQMLYEVDLCECNSRDAKVSATHMLAVFDRWDGLYARVELPHDESVLAVRDVDGDDVEEVLLGRGELRETSHVSYMRLVSLKGGRLRVVHDFGVTGIYSFGDESGPRRVVTVPVIYYVPRGDGEAPEFYVDNYGAECAKDDGCGFVPRPGVWQYLGSGPLTEGDIPRPGPGWNLPYFTPGRPSPPEH